MKLKLTASVKDVMRKNVVSISDKETVKKAALIMKNNDIGSVVVLDKKKTVRGIITKTDIVYKCVAQGKTGLTNVMSKSIITIAPDENIEKAAELMAKSHVEKLLVSEKNKIIGIISATDILKTEPGLHTVLFEMLNRKGAFAKSEESFFGTCESCENYTDDLKEVGGIWVCPECRNE
jgi:CBS domain-containing protein